MSPWRPSKTRKPRSDSKLQGLAKEQRALVDKWLFDKGLTYQEAAEACLQMFGLKVSKSSVGRYHERVARGKVKRVSGRVSKCVSEGKTGTLEENYQECLRLMTKWALEEMRWPVEDERDVKGVLQVMRILISARMEKNEAMMVELARRKFETWAVKECMKYWRSKAVCEGVGKCVSGRQSLHPMVRRGEKDPMMMWDFPDGEIRRMPLMRPAHTEGERDD